MSRQPHAAERSHGQRTSLLRSPVPTSLAGLWFALGAAPLALLGVLGLSGMALAMSYEPGLPQSAHSVAHITESVAFGWYARALHHWAAALFVATSVLHLLRVALARAGRAPRSWTWVVGVTLLGLGMVAVVTGQVLVGDARGYWTLRMLQSAADAVPLFGPSVARWLFGAGLPDGGLFARAYAIHALVLPATVAALVATHLELVRRHGVAPADGKPIPASRPTARPEEGPRLRRRSAAERARDERVAAPFWRVELAVGCAALAAATLLAVVASPAAPAAAIPTQGVEHLAPSWITAPGAWWFDRVPQPFAQLTIGLGAMVLAAWPWVDRWATRSGRPRLASPWWMVVGVVAAVAIGLARLWSSG